MLISLAGINECTSGPCRNGGTCLGLINMFECQCVPGFTGNQREIGSLFLSIKNSKSNVTKKHVLIFVVFRSTCLKFYKKKCNYNCYFFSTDNNECTSGPCHNGGTCLGLIKRFECQCVLGYTGTQCEIGNVFLHY